MVNFPANAADAVRDLVFDGAVIAVGGFGLCGIPEALKKVLEQIPANAHPMDVMRTGCSALPRATASMVTVMVARVPSVCMSRLRKAFLNEAADGAGLGQPRAAAGAGGTGADGQLSRGIGAEAGS